MKKRKYIASKKFVIYVKKDFVLIMTIKISQSKRSLSLNWKKREELLTIFVI